MVWNSCLVLNPGWTLDSPGETFFFFFNINPLALSSLSDGVTQEYVCFKSSPQEILKYNQDGETFTKWSKNNLL